MMMAAMAHDSVSGARPEPMERSGRTNGYWEAKQSHVGVYKANGLWTYPLDIDELIIDGHR
jgi:hypothetical protein